ncbi:MAG: universal stress protein [Bacteroidota bacterium]
MRKLLIATDFSDNATNAVTYGYGLAKQIRANVTICNAFSVLTELPQASAVIWPMDGYDTAISDSVDALANLKHKLQTDYPAGYQPNIILVNETGNVTDVVTDTTETHLAELIVMGTHGDNNISNLLLGNHCRQMIDIATTPLLIVPPTTKFKAIKKIAYATDFKNPQDDLATIYELIRLAKLLNADILLTHVIDDKQESPTFKKWRDDLLTDLSNKADYPRIYYCTVKSRNAENGLDWLCEHGQVDILTLLHRPHNIFDKLLRGSVTQTMAKHAAIPLLVLPQTRR